MKTKIVDLVRNLAEPIATNLGLYIEDIEYVKKNNGMNLTIYISKDNGSIDLNDCEMLTNALNDPLDELDPTNGASYIFNVSSLGLDRPLKTERDFKRNLNSEIEVKLYSPLNGKKEFVGVLTSYTEDFIVLDNEINLNKKDIAIIKPYIKF